MTDPEQVANRVASVLENPSARVIAQTYAEAFLDAGASVGVENALEEFRSFIHDVFQPNPAFADILMSEIVKTDDKLRLINSVLGGVGSEFFVNFLRVLAAHSRLDLLPLILDQSDRLHEERTGRKRVSVTASNSLGDDQKHQVFERLNAALPFEPILEFQVDESLLGGLVIRIGDTVYDTSLRTRVRQLRESLRERNLHEIQSGRDRFSYPEGD